MRIWARDLWEAKKKAGVTQFVMVESLVGSPCVVQVDIPNPRVYINGALAVAPKVRRTETGFYEIDLKRGEAVTFTPDALEKADLKIEPLPVSEADSHLFSLNAKTERLPGHQFYFEK